MYFLGCSYPFVCLFALAYSCLALRQEWNLRIADFQLRLRLGSLEARVEFADSAPWVARR